MQQYEVLFDVEYAWFNPFSRIYGHNIADTVIVR